MSEVGSLGITEVVIISCGCLVPIVLAAVAVIALLVFAGRRKPKAGREPAKPARAAAPVETEPVAEAKPAPAPEPAKKSCASCGADNPEDNAFCEYCGASLAEK